MRRLVIVGERPSPVWDGKPIHALYGNPATRLARAAGWSQDEHDHARCYKEVFRRAHLYNVCAASRFDDTEAALRAGDIMLRHVDGVFLLLGRRVAGAFGHAAPFYEDSVTGGVLTCSVPHPSGLNRLWNDPLTAHRTGDALRRLYAASLHTWP